jgi:sigma-B regulation protein RsbU (phosphoserine phosphatase)
MRIFIAKLVVLVVFFSFFCFPSDQPIAKNIANGQIVLTSSGTPAVQLQENPQSKASGDVPRSGLLEFLFGSFLLFIGLAATVLSLFRWKANDLSLILFGAFCLLYGARTNALRLIFDIPIPMWSFPHWFITYLVPIPAWLFVEQLIGKGWKSSIRRLWQVQIAFSIIAIAVSAYSRNPAAATVANNIMAIIGISVVLANFFQPKLPRSRELKVLRFGFFLFGAMALYENITPLLQEGYKGSILEGVGFFVCIVCLGYVVAQRFFLNEKELITISHELDTAQQIQSFILPGEGVEVENLQVVARYVPMASVAGDFYDFVKLDEKRLGILVADVSGHGVPASLISSMVKIAFASQTSNATDPARVLAEINTILYGKLEADFVTAGYLFVDTAEETVQYAGAGHPPLYVWRGTEKEIYEFRENGIILGQLADAQYQNIMFGLKPQDRLFLYTDGIVEASRATGEIFGFERLKAFMKAHAELPADEFADTFIAHLVNWSGKRTEKSLDDDLTLIVADYKHG